MVPIRERDNNKDQKLDFGEFFPRIFDLVRRVDEDYILSNWDDDEPEALAKKMFSELDNDYDG